MYLVLAWRRDSGLVGRGTIAHPSRRRTSRCARGLMKVKSVKELEAPSDKTIDEIVRTVGKERNLVWEISEKSCEFDKAHRRYRCVQ